VALVIADAQAAMSGASTGKRSALGAFINDMKALADDISACQRAHNLAIAASLDAAS
jgi:hypothetical protein